MKESYFQILFAEREKLSLISYVVQLDVIYIDTNSSNFNSPANYIII